MDDPIQIGRELEDGRGVDVWVCGQRHCWGVAVILGGWGLHKARVGTQPCVGRSSVLGGLWSLALFPWVGDWVGDDDDDDE